MALFGQKCERCGKIRTKETYEGIPTCEACEAMLKARIKADNEEPRGCPLDATKMTKEIVANVVIDRCTTCQGVWLDGGELELLRRAIEFGVSKDFVRGMAYPMF